MSLSKRILPTFILLAVLFGGLPETATALPEVNLMLTVQMMGFGGNQLKLGLLGIIAMGLIALATVVTGKSVQGISSLMYKQQRGMDRATLLVMSAYRKVCAQILETYGEERDTWEEMPTAAQGYDEIFRQEDEVRLRQILAMVGLEPLQAKSGSLLYAKAQDIGGLTYAANDFLDMGSQIEIVPGVIFVRAPRGAFSPAGALFQMNPTEFKAAIEGIDPALGTPSWQQLLENWQQAIQQAQAIGEAHLLPTVAQVDGAAQRVNQRIADMDVTEATRLGTALMRYIGLLHESGHAVVQEVIFNSPAGVPFQTLFAQAFAKNPGLCTMRGSIKGAMQADSSTGAGWGSSRPSATSGRSSCSSRPWPTAKRSASRWIPRPRNWSSSSPAS
jgi:hypothetical protein